MTTPYRPRRHRFSTEIRAALRPLKGLDNWHATAALLQDWSLIVLAAAAPDLLQRWVPWLLTYALALVVIGTRMRALATLTHEAAHSTLARNHVWNRVAGTFLSGYLVLQTLTGYRHNHVGVDGWGHHKLFGDRTRDPDLLEMIDAYREASRARFIFRYLVAPLFCLHVPRKVVNIVAHRFLTRGPGAAEGALSAFYLTGLVLLFASLGLARALVLYWLVPFLTVYMIVDWYIELAEHFPLMEHAELDVQMTRNRWGGAIAAQLVGIHHENLHQVHHLFPSIPFWNLEKAHAILMNDPVYRQSQAEVGLMWGIVGGVPSIVERMLARYPRHPWHHRNKSSGPRSPS